MDLKQYLIMAGIALLGYFLRVRGINLPLFPPVPSPGPVPPPAPQPAPVPVEAVSERLHRVELAAARLEGAMRGSPFTGGPGSPAPAGGAASVQVAEVGSKEYAPPETSRHVITVPVRVELDQGPK